MTESWRIIEYAGENLQHLTHIWRCRHCRQTLMERECTGEDCIFARMPGQEMTNNSELLFAIAEEHRCAAV